MIQISCKTLQIRADCGGSRTIKRQKPVLYTYVNFTQWDYAL